MKKSIFFLALIISFLKLSSQSYYTITFQGNNASPETVRIDNLSQNTNLTINGDDVLRLVFNSTDIENNSQSNSNSIIYPNPMHDVSTLKFDNPATGNVTITIFNITGKKITSFSSTIDNGVHSFILSDFPAGSYIYNINTQSNTISGTFNSINNNLSSPSIKLNSETDNILNKFNSSINKSNKAIVEMNYDIGDFLKITGTAAGFEDAIIYNTPNSDKVFTFNFNAIFVCGNTYTDPRDSTVYNTVQIGNQCWFAENLMYLPNVTTVSDSSDIQPLYYVYGYNGTSVAAAKATSNYLNYGVLYNWTAASNSCPTGWHLPSDTEWSYLITYLGGETSAGNKLKETGTTHWSYSYPNVTNESGFTGLPGGLKDDNNVFSRIRDIGYWWSSTEQIMTPNTYFFRTLNSNSGHVSRASWYNYIGMSVRCIKD
jgi:uncharacterized protein (TIGR02145 family)